MYHLRVGPKGGLTTQFGASIVGRQGNESINISLRGSGLQGSNQERARAGSRVRGFVRSFCAVFHSRPGVRPCPCDRYLVIPTTGDLFGCFTPVGSACVEHVSSRVLHYFAVFSRGDANGQGQGKAQQQQGAEGWVAARSCVPRAVDHLKEAEEEAAAPAAAEPRAVRPLQGIRRLASGAQGAIRWVPLLATTSNAAARRRRLLIWRRARVGLGQRVQHDGDRL